MKNPTNLVVAATRHRHQIVDGGSIPVVNVDPMIRLSRTQKLIVWALQILKLDEDQQILKLVQQYVGVSSFVDIK